MCEFVCRWFFIFRPKSFSHWFYWFIYFSFSCRADGNDNDVGRMNKSFAYAPDCYLLNAHRATNAYIYPNELLYYNYSLLELQWIISEKIVECAQSNHTVSSAHQMISLHLPLTSKPPRKRSHPFSVIFSPNTAKNSLKFSLPNSVRFDGCAANKNEREWERKKNVFSCVVFGMCPSLGMGRSRVNNNWNEQKRLICVLNSVNLV